MTDQDPEPSSADFEWEFRRLGVDIEQLGAVASGSDLSAQDLLTWLRLLLTGRGHAAFLKSLESGGPMPGLAEGGVPPRDPHFSAPDLDLRAALSAEFARLLPSGASWAIMDAFDGATALEALRRLPTGAGFDAVSAVLPVVRLSDSED